MTKESCTEVADLGLRRLRKQQENIAQNLTKAVTHLKEIEMALLRSHIAMGEADWAEAEGFCQESLLKIREHAWAIEDASKDTHDILMRVCKELGYDDPFSTGGSG